MGLNNDVNVWLNCLTLLGITESLFTEIYSHLKNRLQLSKNPHSVKKSQTDNKLFCLFLEVFGIPLNITLARLGTVLP